MHSLFCVQVHPERSRHTTEIRGEAFGKGRPLRTVSELYEPLEFEALDTPKEAFDIAQLQDLDRDTGLLERWISDHGGTLKDYAFFPFGARYKFAFLGVSRSSGEVKGLLDLSRLGVDEPATITLEFGK